MKVIIELGVSSFVIEFSQQYIDQENYCLTKHQYKTKFIKLKEEKQQD